MPDPFSFDSAPLAPLPRAGERALVIAPHPDDEALGCGGWIFLARQRGADVRLLFLTDGDAFRLAAWRSERRFPSKAACLALGRRRRDEAVAAAAALGLPESSLRFLGFPDRGLAEMRRAKWRLRPYPSPYTGRVSNVEALRDRLLEQITEFAPQFVLTSDPEDDHSDHRATAAFTREALAGLAGDHLPGWVGTYLIHCGLWPAPHRYVSGAGLAPPNRLARTERKWMPSPLSGEALRVKAAALSAYESQARWAKPLFGAHQRTNELLCETAY